MYQCFSTTRAEAIFAPQFCSTTRRQSLCAQNHFRIQPRWNRLPIKGGCLLTSSLRRKGVHVHVRERFAGSFHRAIELPHDAGADKLMARHAYLEQRDNFHEIVSAYLDLCQRTPMRAAKAETGRWVDRLQNRECSRRDLAAEFD
jgi:hypothetical protein